MKKENIELNLLSGVLKALIECTEPNEILNTLEKILNKFGKKSKSFNNLKSLNIYIYDESTKTLKDFSKSWIVIDKETNDHHKILYSAIDNLSRFDFFINENSYKTKDISDSGNIKTKDKNTVLFPLRKGRKAFGLLELSFDSNIKNLLDYDFFMMLSIATYQISLKIQNTILTDQMQKNIDFHKSMKDIAKIIETQYELNYIIPIIGEMIDRFVSEHLIYVFLKDEKSSEFNLVWPNACIDKNILNVISGIGNKTKPFTKNDGKLGIFPIIGKKILGCIVAHSPTEKLSSKDFDYLEQLSKQSSITIQRAHSYSEVLQYATLDALTGLNNRRQFESRLKQEISLAERQKKPLCTIVIDIDFFKKVNDTYGHIAGDCVLKNVSQIIQREIRESDIASRYGGEEFVILLPFTSINDALPVAERLRHAVEKSTTKVPEEKGSSSLSIKVTISMGINEYKHGDTPQSLFEKADQALYESKTSGRNRISIYK